MSRLHSACPPVLSFLPLLPVVVGSFFAGLVASPLHAEESVFIRVDGFSDTRAELDDVLYSNQLKGIPAAHIRVGGHYKLPFPETVSGDDWMVSILYSGDSFIRTVETLQGKRIPVGAPAMELSFAGQEPERLSSFFEKLGPEPELEGKFFYRTYAIPAELANSADASERFLSLRPQEKVGGFYATVGGGAAREVDPSLYSREVYAVFFHRGNRLRFPSPGGEELLPLSAEIVPSVQGLDVIDSDLIGERLLSAIDAGIEEVKGRQLFGPVFEEAQRDLGIPAAITGLFDFQGLDSYLQRGRSNNWQPDALDWKTRVTGSANGRSHARAAYLFLKGYGLEGSVHFEDPVLIERAIAALDGYARYQGRDGGLEIGGGKWGWIGGPERKRANGGLQGFFMQGLARSALELSRILDADDEAWTVQIDSNADGTLDSSRRDAYRMIFEKYLDGQLKMGGGVANQARANALGALYAREAVQALGGDSARFDADIEELVKASTGIIGSEFRGHWMLSDAGTSWEFGFCPQYSQHGVYQFAVLDELARDAGPELAQMSEQRAKAFDALTPFLFWVENSDGHDWLIEGPTGSRKHPFPGAAPDWLSFTRAALDFEHPMAQAVFLNGLAGTDNLVGFSVGSEWRMHQPKQLDNAIQLLERKDALVELLVAQRAQQEKGPTKVSVPEVFVDNENELLALNTEQYRLFLQEDKYHLVSKHYHAFGDLRSDRSDGLMATKMGELSVFRNISKDTTLGDDFYRVAYLDPEKARTVRALDVDEADIRIGGEPFSVEGSIVPALGVSDSKSSEGEHAFLWELPEPPADQSYFLSLVGQLEGSQLSGVMAEPGRLILLLYDAATGAPLPSISAAGYSLSPLGLVVDFSTVDGEAADFASRIAARVLLPTFTSFEEWQFDAGKQWPGVVSSAGDTLEWKVEQRNHHFNPNFASSYQVELDEPATSVEFDYQFRGLAERLSIELTDEDGQVLWRNDDIDSQRSIYTKTIRVDGFTPTDKLRFRVYTESTEGKIIYPNYFHQIDNLYTNLER